MKFKIKQTYDLRIKNILWKIIGIYEMVDSLKHMDNKTKLQIYEMLGDLRNYVIKCYKSF